MYMLTCGVVVAASWLIVNLAIIPMLVLLVVALAIDGILRGTYGAARAGFQVAGLRREISKDNNRHVLVLVSFPILAVLVSLDSAFGPN